MYVPLHEGHETTQAATSGVGTELTIGLVIGLMLLAVLAYTVKSRTNTE